MTTEEKKYYPIDAYYSYKDNKLHYIVKEVNADGVGKKITGCKKNPDYKIKLAKFTKRIKYTLPHDEIVKEITVPYRDYNRLKKSLAAAYDGKKDIKALNKFLGILSFQYDIYDDYKIETQFLQQEVFKYDDNYIDNIKVGIFDIEVFHDDTEFPEPEEAKYEINSISHIDLLTNTVSVYFLYNELHHDKIEGFDNAVYKKLKEEYGDTFLYKLHKFTSEKKLLLEYLKYISDFDVMVGWNSLNFDTLYIYTRCIKLKMAGAFKDSFGELYQTLNIVDSKNGMNSFTYYTTKILSLDYIHLIKFYSRINYPSYSLNKIAEKILKNEDDHIASKVEVANLNVEYLENPANFINYNVGDVLLNKFIDDKLLFVKILFKQKMMTRGFGVATLSINNILDAYISTQSKKYGLMVTSTVKVQSFYTSKIWNMYRRLNFLNDSRLELIQKLRESNKTFSLFTNEEELNEIKYNIYNDLTEEDLKKVDLTNIKLTKGQFPFIWDSDKYPGGYVKVPNKGIHLNVLDFDATAMYPSSIYSTNNGCNTWVYQVPENLALLYLYERDNFITFVKSNENLVIEIYDILNDVFKKFKHTEIIEVFKKMFEKELVLTETGAVFLPAHIKESFFRKLIIYPISDRQSIKAEMQKKIKEDGLMADDPEILNLNISQLVDKIIANSIYGYLGFRKSRLFNIILATTITMNCQFMIRYVAINSSKIIENIND
jgi:DNA polymerase elongation subunit (family B)